MSWREKMKEFGGGDLTFLSSDGECLVFVVADEPILLKGKYKGKEQDRIGCPVVTDEGFVLFVTGKRVARKISKFESSFKSTPIMVVRHGESGDVNCSYSVSLYKNKEIAQRLLELVKTEYTKEKLQDAIKDAEECMNN